MALRLILLIIPLLTFLLPARWFSFYARLMIMLALAQIALMILLREEYALALSSFGLEVVLGYIAINLVLLGVRTHLIRRARARIIKLPAPYHHLRTLLSSYFHQDFDIIYTSFAEAVIDYKRTHGKNDSAMLIKDIVDFKDVHTKNLLSAFNTIFQPDLRMAENDSELLTWFKEVVAILQDEHHAHHRD